jgi:predicted acyltransferase
MLSRMGDAMARMVMVAGGVLAACAMAGMYMPRISTDGPGSPQVNLLLAGIGLVLFIFGYWKSR